MPFHALAIEVAQRKPNAVPGLWRVALRQDFESLEQLAEAVGAAAAAERRQAKTIVRELLERRLATEVDKRLEGLTVDIVSDGRFAGQVIRDGAGIVYASIVATSRSMTAPRSRNASPFRN